VIHAAPRWDGDALQFVDQLLVWMQAVGSNYYDEAVTEFEHALQSGALALEQGQPDKIVAACFLHDVGHLLLDEHSRRVDSLDTDLQHERIGSKWLARAFNAEVSGPVGLHVAAKRYLCTIDAHYHSGLSASSKRSLVVQGGPMSLEQAAAFAAIPGAQEATIVRRIDDKAKVSGQKVPPALVYREMLIRQVELARPDSI
jgi:predicted HD phosphohydrolase